MNAAGSFVVGDSMAVLDRHSVRRSNGVPTVSLLVGPIGAGGATWRRWGDATGQRVLVVHRDVFPAVEWIRSVVEKFDLPAAAVRAMAERVARNPDEFLAEWRAKTPADRERFWSSLALRPNDDRLRSVADLIDRSSGTTVAAGLCDMGESIVPTIVRLSPAAIWPSVLFITGSTHDLSSIGHLAAKWAMRVPALPMAVAVPANVWDAFLSTEPESRAKALLREGELTVPVVDAATVERTLIAAGAPKSAIATIVASGADKALLESVQDVKQATAARPFTGEANDRARSAAERFLFEFLESLAETAGRFELNAPLDFRFGPKPIEVDLLCREARIAIEIDGFFHFIDSVCYRRDRAKDWELQRRGYIVLRFLAEDVIPNLDIIRDRILDALARTSNGD